MKIAILTVGRFHVCDLARELDALGHNVSFYSLVPPWRSARFGLPYRCSRCLLPYVAPFLAAAEVARGTSLAHKASQLLTEALDRTAARVIGPCDVFIGMSGMCRYTVEAVRRKYGARILLERGSRHILSQKQILDEILDGESSAPTVSERTVERELAEYDAADFIVVPSRHVMASFIERGFSTSKLFRNPYGVDLNMFPPTLAPRGVPYIIMTGTWSRRKGCDILADAWRKTKVHMMHVGAVDDAPLPAEPGFHHYAPVQQSCLSQFYSQAHVFALASREEGLALVQAQALASGLPVVCTDRTGGEDLREYLPDQRAIAVVPTNDTDAFATALQNALDLTKNQVGIRDLLGSVRSAFSWRAYGQRYNEMLKRLN